MEFCFLFFWDTLGVTGKGSGSLVWLEELVWEAFLGCLESSPIVSDVDVVAGA